MPVGGKVEMKGVGGFAASVKPRSTGATAPSPDAPPASASLPETPDLTKDEPSTSMSAPPSATVSPAAPEAKRDPFARLPEQEQERLRQSRARTHELQQAYHKGKGRF